MRLRSTLTLTTGPLAGLGYALLWALLWPTAQPDWTLQFGLRFGVLLLAPFRYWGWLIGGELIAAGLIDYLHGYTMGWRAFVFGDLPQPIVVALCLGLLRRANLRPTLRDPEEVSRLLLSAGFTVVAATATDALMLALVHQLPPVGLLHALGNELLGNYVGLLLLVPPLIMIWRARPSKQELSELLMDGLLVMLPALVILLILTEQA
jgi:two-component system, NarL family, sensor histidine kinase FusK